MSVKQREAVLLPFTKTQTSKDMNGPLKVDNPLVVSQSRKILDYIKLYGSISTYEAYMRLGITSLHRRLSDLRKQGYEFNKAVATKVTVDEYGRKITKRFKRYSLAG